MDILNKLTIKNLKLNKKRTIVTIIGIILSVALICAVTSMYTSAISSLIKFETSEKGDFHYVFYNVPVSDLVNFENNRKIEKLNITKHLGYAVLEESKNDYKPYAHIMGFTSDSLKNLSIKLVDGRLPQKDDEILIPTHLKTNGRISLNIGETITLEVGRRVSDDSELNQKNPFLGLDEEKIVDTSCKTYKIVGIIERPATNIESYSAPGYTFITYMEQNDMTDVVDVYTRYTKDGLENQYKVTADILGVDSKLFEKVSSGRYYTEEELKTYTSEIEKSGYEVDINSYLISLEVDPLNNNDVGDLGIVVFIVCTIIVFTSVFCIKNSFDISITEKTKQYGMLRSIGATKKQIKRNVFYEAFALGIIGIPLGILIGVIASYILIIICNFFLEGAFVSNLKLVFDLSFPAIIFSVILGVITVYLSALRVAIRASKISPIDSIRNNTNIQLKSKRLKGSKIVNKLFGVGGDISYKNIKRNKKKYRTTVISIAVSVLTFVALSSFVDVAFLTVENELKASDYNIYLTAKPENNTGFYNKVLETVGLNTIEEYTIKNQKDLSVSSSNYSKAYVQAGNYVFDENIDAFINIYSVGEESYKNYLKKLGLSYEEAKDKAVLVDKEKVAAYNEKKRKYDYFVERAFSYKVGDTISGILDKNNYGEKEFEIEVIAVSDEMPFAITNDAGPMIIVSDELYNRKIKEEYEEKIVLIFYKSNDPNKLQDYIEEYLKDYNFDYSIHNIAENTQMMRNLITLISIFLYGFIIVISLIGITNIFNTITTNMYLRKQEFAMLKSIGMTKGEFNRMIRLESIFIGMKSLMFGLPIGIALSYLIHYFLTKESGIEYPFPIMAIMVSIIAVFILITSLMKYSMSKINKQNTIETIRNENI